MQAKSDDCVCTLADPLANIVVVKVLYRTIWSAELDMVLIWLSITLVYLCLIQRMSLVLVGISRCWNELIVLAYLIFVLLVILGIVSFSG